MQKLDETFCIVKKRSNIQKNVCLAIFKMLRGGYMRAPFQVSIIAFRKVNEGYEFLVLERADMSIWQWISGGGEDEESPLIAAIRETQEEIGIITKKFIKLDTVASIPSIYFRDHEKWGSDVIVIPEHSFGVDIADEKVNLSDEHTQYRWKKYIEAKTLLKYDSNKTALYELNKRLEKDMLIYLI